MPPRPSLRALRTFAEVTRTGGIAPAARALGISPSAVSHILHELERTLGVALFAGQGPRAPLSEAGERLRRGLGNAFEVIEAAVAEATRHAGEVRVSALATFSTLWLIPRLGRFHATHPETRLLLATDTRAVDLAAEPYDCAIRHGLGEWSDLEATLLFRECIALVANPRLLEESRDLTRLPRLAARTRPHDWPCVLSALGLPRLLTPTMTFQNSAQAVQAALAGLGVAVIDRTLVTDLIAAGMLAPAIPDWPGRELRTGFFFVSRTERLRDRHVRGLRDWLTEEIANF
jgi:DNA-binding transcriptional LysR family regulator